MAHWNSASNSSGRRFYNTTAAEKITKTEATVTPATATATATTATARDKLHEMMVKDREFDLIHHVDIMPYKSMYHLNTNTFTNDTC